MVIPKPAAARALRRCLGGRAVVRTRTIHVPAGRSAESVRSDAITDGPFVDAKEVVAGVYVIEAPDLDAAIAVARLNPVLGDGGGLEIRPVAAGGPVERGEQAAG